MALALAPPGSRDTRCVTEVLTKAPELKMPHLKAGMRLLWYRIYIRVDLNPLWLVPLNPSHISYPAFSHMKRWGLELEEPFMRDLLVCWVQIPLPISHLKPKESDHNKNTWKAWYMFSGLGDIVTPHGKSGWLLQWQSKGWGLVRLLQGCLRTSLWTTCRSLMWRRQREACPEAYIVLHRKMPDVPPEEAAIAGASP